MPASREKIRARNRQVGLAACTALAAAALLFGGGAYLISKAQAPQGGAGAPAVQTMVLSAGSFSSDLDVTGSIQSASESAVSSELEGTVLELLVAEGDRVEKGDLLAVLGNEQVEQATAEALTSYRKAQAAQRAAEADLSATEEKMPAVSKALSKAQAALDRAREEAQQAQEKDPGYVFDEEPLLKVLEAAQAAVDAVQGELDQRSAALAKAEKAAAKERSAYTKARRTQDKLKLRAPQAGSVVDLAVEPGAQVGGAAGEPLMRVLDTSNVNCVVQVPESKVGNISKGQQARVSCDGGEQLRAVVFKVADTPCAVKAPAGQQASGSFMGDASSNGTFYDVTLVFDERQRGLAVGMPAKATITIQDYGTVYYVPATAVGSGSSGLYLEAVVDETTTKQCSLTLIGTAPDGQLVVQGVSLAEGMHVITEP